MAAYGVIYLVRNKADGKIYIGRTTQHLSIRWAGHVHDSKGSATTGLHGAIKRQGPDNFTIEEIEAHSDKRSLMVAERDAIERYHARDPNVGYNLSAGYQGKSTIVGSEKVYSEILKIRLTKSTYQAMALRAGAEERTLSDWARRVLEAKLRSTGLETMSPPITESLSETIPPQVSEPETSTLTPVEPVSVPVADTEWDLDDFLSREFGP